LPLATPSNCWRSPAPRPLWLRSCIDAHGGRDRQEALFQLIDATQAQRLLGPLAPVDFRALSAVGKPASYRYPFSLQLLLR